MIHEEEKINVVDILMEEERLKIQFQSEGHHRDEADKMAFHAIKQKYSKYDY